MKKEFVPYEQALALKELGFDEPCFAWYSDKNIRISGMDGCVVNKPIKNSFFTEDDEFVSAPTFSQAFRWFREKYVLDSIVQPTYSTKYQYRIFNVETKSKTQVYGDYMGKEFNTYEEAELACLIKLIEIVKEK